MKQGPVHLHVFSSLALPPNPFANLAQLPGIVPSLILLALFHLRLFFTSSHCHKIRRAGHLFNNFFDPLCTSQYNPGTEEGLKNKCRQLKCKMSLWSQFEDHLYQIEISIYIFFSTRQ